MELQIFLINGDFHVHRAGCADVDKIRRRRLSDSPGHIEVHDSREAVVMDSWGDIVAEYESERDFVIEQGTATPEEAEADYQACIRSLWAATQFKPCTRGLPERSPADGGQDGQQDSAPAAAAAPDGQLAAECERCGFTFRRPQRRPLCQSAAACGKRQAARAGAGAAR